MAKLILSLDNVNLSEHPLNKVNTSIGRRTTNDLHLDNLAVSGEHAVIIKKDNGYYLEDLGSTNGTLVNGKVVSKHLLQQDDVIELGKFQLKYLNDSQSENTNKANLTPAFEKTMMMRLPAAKSRRVAKPEDTSAVEPLSTKEKSAIATPDNTPATSLASALPEMIGKIQVLNGSGSGRELVLNKALTTLGRAGVQVCVITKRPHGYFITHVEGKVFPMVNGSPIGPQAFLLSAHDVIELAGVKMEFYLTKS